MRAHGSNAARARLEACRPSEDELGASAHKVRRRRQGHAAPSLLGRALPPDLLFHPLAGLGRSLGAEGSRPGLDGKGPSPGRPTRRRPAAGVPLLRGAGLLERWTTIPKELHSRRSGPAEAEGAGSTRASRRVGGASLGEGFRIDRRGRVEEGSGCCDAQRERG